MLTRRTFGRLAVGAISVSLAPASPLLSLDTFNEVRVGLESYSLTPIPQAELFDTMVSTNPDNISTPADYEEAVTFSDRYGIDLDIGDATGSGYDVLPFIRKNHGRIFRIALKDRRHDHTSMPWGQGDTPLKEVMQFVRDNHSPSICHIDGDAATASTAEIRKCGTYLKAVLT
jgi:sugar phosphate isomerase/epimerase